MAPTLFSHSFIRSFLRLSPLAALIYLVWQTSRLSSTQPLQHITLHHLSTSSSPEDAKAQRAASYWLRRKASGHQIALGYGDESDRPDAMALASVARAAPKPQRPYKMVMCSRIFNEARYLEEWILYHYLLGFDHFMLNDHGSTDNSSAVLKPYIDAGMVTLTETDPNITIVDSEVSSRIHCYDGSVIPNEDMDWVAQIDLDEVLVLSQARIPAQKLRPTALHRLMDDFTNRKESVIQTTRFHFGTNNHIEVPPWPMGQGDAFTERQIVDYSGNFWPKILVKAGHWEFTPGAAHASQHTAVGIDGWKKVTPIHEEIPERGEDEDEWHHINSYPPVFDPFHIVHFQTRSLNECLAKQRDPKTGGSWRAEAGADETCNKWHPDHPVYKPEQFTEYLSLKNSVYNRATRYLMRTGGLFAKESHHH